MAAGTIQRHPDAEPPTQSVFTENALLDALLTHPELITKDLFWAHGKWMIGPPQISENGLQQRDRTMAPPEISDLLPPTPPELTGSIQQLIPRQTAALRTYRARLEIDHNDAAKLDIWHTPGRGWTRGPNGQPLPAQPYNPPNGGTYFGPLFMPNHMSAYDNAAQDSNLTVHPTGHGTTAASQSDHTEPHDSADLSGADSTTSSDDSDDDDDDSEDSNASSPSHTRTPLPATPAARARAPPTGTQAGGDRQILSQETRDPHAEFQCILTDCPDGNQCFDTRAELATHLRKAAHAPLNTIPREALRRAKIYRCKHGCGEQKIYAQLMRACRHEHICSSRPAAPPRSNTPRDDISPVSYDKAIARNMPHLREIEQRPSMLMHVQGSSIPFIPNGPSAMFDSLYTAIFVAANRNLDDSAPALILAASTRYLLAPPDEKEAAGLLPARLSERVRRLVAGEGAALWNEHNWIADLPVVDTIRSVTPDMIPRIVQSSFASANPGRLFKRLNAIPFCPPTDTVRELLASKINSAPNEDAEWLAQIALEHLPQQPHGRATPLTQKQTERICTEWTRTLDKSNPSGAPDGTGLRFSYLQGALCARPAFALWMAHLASHKRSPFLAWWFLTCTLTGQCKTDDQGRYPTNPADITSARPISRLLILRRLIAKLLSPRICKAIRPILEPYRQYGLSPSGCPTVSITGQLHCDLAPESPHAPLDIQNAHSAISRKPIILTLLMMVKRYPENPAHRNHLLWNLAFYAVSHTVVFIQTDKPSVAPFCETTQTDSLLQGDGVATPTFDLTYTIQIIPKLISCFPSNTFDEILCHDDTTVIASTYLLPEDDPDGTRLAEISDDELRRLILSFSRCDLDPVEAARQFHSADPDDEIDPSITALRRYLIPHFPLIVAVFGHLIYSRLNMRLAPGKKMQFFQLPQPAKSRLAIRKDDTFWTPLLPDNVRYIHTAYVVAGAHVGDNDSITSGLAQLHRPYDDLMQQVTEASGTHTFPCLIAVRIAYAPTTKFGHHFSAHPPALTNTAAVRMRACLFDNMEKLLRLPPGTLSASPDDVSAGHRFCDPISEGGCGFADPTSQRMTSFPANLVNCLPLLLTNPVIRHWITQTSQWRTSASLTLRSAHALLTGMARLARQPGLTDEGQPSGTNPSHSPIFIKTLLSSVSTDGSISAEQLAAAAHHHGHRTLARLHSAHRARQRELAVPLTQVVEVTRAASKAWGAAPLLNSYAISADNKLTTNQITFLICHRLGLPLPFLSPPYYCSPLCGRLVQPYTLYPPTGDLAATFSHGYHQSQCSLSYLVTEKHNAWLKVLARYLRKWCGLQCILGEHLQHSEDNRKTIDIIIITPGRLDEWPLACDPTTINPMLPSYLSKKGDVLLKAFKAKHAEKMRKHAQACEALNRAFLPIIISTTGAVGMNDFHQWWDAVWAQAVHDQQLLGMHAFEVNRAKQHAESALHATIVVHTANAIEFLRTPPPQLHHAQ